MKIHVNQFFVKGISFIILKLAFYYHNTNDPYHIHRIPCIEMDAALEQKFKTELVAKLKSINDQWAQDKICGGYLEY